VSKPPSPLQLLSNICRGEVYLPVWRPINIDHLVGAAPQSSTCRQGLGCSADIISVKFDRGGLSREFGSGFEVSPDSKRSCSSLIGSVSDRLVGCAPGISLWTRGTHASSRRDSYGVGGPPLWQSAWTRPTKQDRPPLAVYHIAALCQPYARAAGIRRSVPLGRLASRAESTRPAATLSYSSGT